MNDAPEFQPYGLPHLTVIFVTIVLPFALAALVRRKKSQRIERVIIAALSAVLILNYLAFLVFIRSHGVVDWRQMLPMHYAMAARSEERTSELQSRPPLV